MDPPQVVLPQQPSFAALVLTDLVVWVTLPIVLALVVAAPFLRSQGTQTEIVFLGLGVVMLAIGGWEIYVLFGLSRRGIVAPGVLVDEEISRTPKSTSYGATYGFDVGGQQFTCTHTYNLPGSVRNDVRILFDAKNPKRARVLPTILGSA
jgi:hypothetical protein